MTYNYFDNNTIVAITLRTQSPSLLSLIPPTLTALVSINIRINCKFTQNFARFVTLNHQTVNVLETNTPQST